MMHVSFLGFNVTQCQDTEKQENQSNHLMCLVSKIRQESRNPTKITVFYNESSEISKIVSQLIQKYSLEKSFQSTSQ